MSGRTPKGRKNRFKKNSALKRHQTIQRLKVGLKLGGLILILLAASALFMAGYAAVTQSDYFRIESIQAHGNQRLSARSVINQAMLSTGDNVLAVNLHLVRKRLVAHPWIASARVVREIPGTLHLHIEEHQPLAVLDLGRRFLINARGHIFKEYENDDPRKLPMVTGIAYADISLGRDALGPAMQTVLALLEIGCQKNSALPCQAIARVHFDAQLGLTLTTRQGQRTIKLGNDRFKEKHARLGRLLPYLKQAKQWRSVKTIDLNDPDRVVVRFDRTPVSKKRS